MKLLTIEHTETSEGYTLVRSDGERFLLQWKDRGNAVLYHLGQGHIPPPFGIVDFDISVTDKLEASRRYVLMFPDLPTS